MNKHSISKFVSLIGVLVISGTGCRTKKEFQAKCYRGYTVVDGTLEVKTCDVREMYDPVARKKYPVSSSDSSFIVRKEYHNLSTGRTVTELFYHDEVRISYETRNGYVDGCYLVYYLPHCKQINIEATFKKGKLDGYYNEYYIDGDRTVHRLYRNGKLIKDESRTK